MKPRIWLLALTILLGIGPENIHADIVVVRLGDILIAMEGKVNNPKDRIIAVTHEKFRKGADGRDLKLNLYFRNNRELLSIQDMIIVPSRKTEFQNRFNKAQKGNAGDRMDLAHWAVTHGMVAEFYRAIELVLQAEPENAKAKEVLALRDRLAPAIADSTAEQKFLSDMLGSGMKFKTSSHYIVAYDTTDNKAQERLDLLERVYETFFMFFAIKGRVLDKPQQRMMVALFNDHKNYLEFSTRLDPELKSAAGYWSPESNVAVFFAQGTYPSFKRLKDSSEQLEKDRKEAERLRLPDRGDLVRLADAVKLLMMVSEENEDIEVVTHEGTHQLAGNSGLFPRRIRIPKFAQEGLAAFFEAPNDATWSGVGAVNQNRIEWYRALAQHDRVHSNIDFIVSDQVYSHTGGVGSNIMHAYGQAWGLTHFLVDKHFNELNEYWKNLARLPADMIISESDLVHCFDVAFGKDRSKLDLEWRRHMDNLKTDMDRLQEQYGDKLRG